MKTTFFFSPSDIVNVLKALALTQRLDKEHGPHRIRLQGLDAKRDNAVLATPTRHPGLFFMPLIWQIWLLTEYQDDDIPDICGLNADVGTTDIMIVKACTGSKRCMIKPSAFEKFRGGGCLIQTRGTTYKYMYLLPFMHTPLYSYRYYNNITG